MAPAPPLPEGYDLCQALIANREEERPPFAQPGDGCNP